MDPPSATGFRKLFAVGFLALSGLGIYVIHGHLAGSQFSDHLVNEACPKPPTFKSPTQLQLTSFAPLDSFLCILTSLFKVANVPPVRDFTNWFLASLGPFYAVILMEAARADAPAAIVYVNIFWGLLLQTIGAGVAAPLMWFLYLISNATARKPVSPLDGQGIFFGLLLGCFLPTLLMFMKPDNMYITAAWQPLPLYVAIIQLLFSKFKMPFLGRSITTATLLLTGVIAAMSHAATLHIRILSNWSAIFDIYNNFPSISIPNHILSSPSDDVAQMLQWDAILTLGSTCLLGLIISEPGDRPFVLMMIAFGTCLFGPGAVIAIIWLLRESQLSQRAKPKKD